MISLSIHTDFHGRFPDSYHLCSYAGLVPSTHSSGGITYHGSITKRGSKYLRWIMLECAHAHIRLDVLTLTPPLFPFPNFSPPNVYIIFDENSKYNRQDYKTSNRGQP